MYLVRDNWLGTELMFFAAQNEATSFAGVQIYCKDAGLPLESINSTLDNLMTDGLLAVSDDNIFLTAKGLKLMTLLAEAGKTL